ncbi:D-inositol-3-phosphate glycosyltransferase [bacterium BMS3Abin15]|nr:D-inositol-3-phosphate glycosyltransferase [bacterium BMS3Abin15]HDH07521.1 glycosyltransferase [Candidatus Moranbacteria bacterium]HDZ85608.1 glycosyltransferase [Candidatus Moranbacteria bacterium]
MKKSKRLRVAMVAPPFGDIGGPEVLVKQLTNALLKIGADVTLFAPADWKTKAKHIPTLSQSLWNMADFKKQTRRVRNNLIVSSQVKILAYQKDFDIIHLNSQGLAYAIGINATIPCVLSLHNKIITSAFKQFKKAKIYTVSLSKAQQGKFKTSANIWNGISTKDTPYSLKRGRHLIFIGRLTDYKGADTAIQVAKEANKKLLIFGRIGATIERQTYFKEKIKPLIDGKQIVYMDEVSNKKIYHYLRDAEALLFPLRRPDICPMIVSEALACGTPIIGTVIQPLPELLGKNNKIATLSNRKRDLVRAAKNTDQFDRKECRKYAEKYFDSSIMAEKYIKLYKKILRDKQG